MHSVLFTDRTTYAACGPRRESMVVELAEARRRLAELLRQVRRDVSVVVIRDKPAFRVLRQYFLTNTVGAMVFERTVTIEGRAPVAVPHTSSLFGTLGSCTCGFADVPAELPCQVHDPVQYGLAGDFDEDLPDSFFDDDKRERNDSLDEFDGEAWT